MEKSRLGGKKGWKRGDSGIQLVYLSMLRSVHRR